MERPGRRIGIQTWVGAETPFTQSYENHFVELGPVKQAVRATAPGIVIAEARFSAVRWSEVSFIINGSVHKDCTGPP